MNLPKATYSDGLTKDVQTAFYGVNHNRAAADGEIWDMRNLCSREYPVLSVRPQRHLYKTLEKPNGIYAWDGLCYVDGKKLYFNDTLLTSDLEDSKKVFQGIGNYIVILPDKLWIKTDEETWGHLESRWSGGTLIIGNGTLYGESAEANMLQREGVDWAELFSKGDAVTISGCTAHPENNKTAIIREIDGDKLLFYENAFKLSGEDGTTAYVEQGALKIERTVPDMDYLCENENRLWGCKGNDIYSCKLGDIFNWNVYDGLSTDSYAVTVGSAGLFTGCVSYGGYATFFKDDRIYRLYGSYPSQYQLMGSSTLGLEAGSPKGMAIAGETLIYLSRAGFTAYTGGVPSTIGQALGTEDIRNAVAGSSGLKYYASAKQGGKSLLYVYDTVYNCWHIEDECEAVGFAYHSEALYMLTADGQIWIIGDSVPNGCTAEGKVVWSCEFADCTAASPNAKGLNALQLRFDMDPKAWAKAEIMADSDGRWLPIGRIDAAEEKRSSLLPIRLQRCDHYRIRLHGEGGCRIYSIARQYYTGSEFKTTRRV